MKKTVSDLPILPPQAYLRDMREAEVSPWTELLSAAELLLLRATPVYYGFGVPKGDRSGVVIIPGFLGTDMYLVELNAWLRRIGYQPYYSGIGINAECPNLLIRRRLTETIDKARKETRRKIHLIGHSLGGIIARAVAHQRPDDVASVITLGSPFRGAVAHGNILRAAESIRKKIQEEHGPNVLPACYTGHCTCDFVESIRCQTPLSVTSTAIYTRNDGVVDWHYCITGDPDVDCEVAATHMGLAFNASVYMKIAERLALARTTRKQ